MWKMRICHDGFGRAWPGFGVDLDLGLILVGIYCKAWRLKWVDRGMEFGFGFG